ncbi:hypothetical protein GCM10007927_39850 [Sulfitobacter pacificus]|uniref:Uncharacterized protein n=1 Tax=Sulfitobacter pacificus TaxID=1499314 RepID=A0ABQ5VQJ4_9RHOB|nr:hypothetical protein GCM10007927_39850 [Sulfitobacter pacificus]
MACASNCSELPAEHTKSHSRLGLPITVDTALASNFADVRDEPFSVDAAIRYLETLPVGKHPPEAVAVPY